MRTRRLWLESDRANSGQSGADNLQRQSQQWLCLIRLFHLSVIGVNSSAEHLVFISHTLIYSRALLEQPDMHHYSLESLKRRLRDIMQRLLPSLNSAHSVFSQVAHMLKESTNLVGNSYQNGGFSYCPESLSVLALLSYRYSFPLEEWQISLGANLVVEISESADTKPPRRPYAFWGLLLACNFSCSVISLMSAV